MVGAVSSPADRRHHRSDLGVPQMTSADIVITRTELVITQMRKDSNDGLSRTRDHIWFRCMPCAAGKPTTSKMNLTYITLAIFNVLLTTWRCVNRWTSEAPPAVRKSLCKTIEMSTILTDLPLANPQMLQATAIAAMTTHSNYLSASPTVQSP